MNESLPKHVQAMLHPTFYPHVANSISLIQTHISWVILTGPYAYKLKKPHDFGFLNFSTLKLRKHFCEMELELNRRLAPELYLDVIPVRQNGTNLSLAGDNGTIIDYCVKMKQFDQSALLNDQIHHADFNPACMDKLAAIIAKFHASFPLIGEPGEAGSPDMLLHHILDNLRFGRTLPQPPKQDIISQLEQQSRQSIRQLTPELEIRRRDGFIRECHGDLHLNNIALIDDRPTAFDCIEFNDEYRILDVMSDVAFLVMDCDAKHRPDLGFRFLSRYLEHSGDYQGLWLLSLYCSYRAGVRGKVACLLSEEPGLNDTDIEHQIADAQRYFRLALGYNSKPSPRLFAIGGFSGSGKSHLALKGCGPERAIIIRSDATRKRLARQHPDLPLYGEEMTENTYQALFKAAGQTLEAGYSAILDATFLDAAQRQHFREMAGTAHAPSRFFWLDIPEGELRQRMTSRQQRGNDVSDADMEILEAQLAQFTEPKEDGIFLLKNSAQWPTE